MQPKHLIPALLLFLHCLAAAQTSWRIDHLGVEDGLSQGYVYAIHQDRKGFIWIGTHGGLHRFDGYGFRQFQYAPFDAATLGDNGIFFLQQDPGSDKFWIGSSSCLNEFDPHSFQNKRYYYTDKELEFSDGLFISQHELLLACEFDVLLFNTRTKQFSHVPVYNENNQLLSLSRVENLSMDKAGHAMVMSRNGIFFYDPVKKACFRKISNGPDLSPFSEMEVFHVLQDNNGFYWIATNRQGLIRYDAGRKEMKQLPLPAGMQHDPPRFDISMQDSKGFLWAASTKGIFRIDPGSLQYQHFSSTSTLFKIPQEAINVIKEDSDGNIWAGTVGSGLSRISPQPSGFKSWKLAQHHAGAPGNYIMGVQQLDKQLWFINIWDQVGYVDLKSNQTTLLPAESLPKEYRWYNEGTITSVKPNEILIMNGEHTLFLNNMNGKTNIQLKKTPGLFYCYATHGGRIYYMVRRNVQQTYISGDTIYGNHFFYDAAEDKKGRIWIGSSEGLICFVPEKRSFRYFRHHDLDLNSISSNFIYSLVYDADQDALWMAAYNGGLCQYSLARNQFKTFRKDDGLSDNTVYAIEQDAQGNLWFSSNAGLSVLRKSTGRFTNFSTKDGLLNQEFNRRAVYRNAAGWIHFGGMEGIDYFHPDSIVKLESAPALVFTGFRIYNEDYIPEKGLAEPLIQMQSNQRFLSVEFAALDYKSPERIQYAYKLDDEEWIQTGNRRMLSISNLTKGKHRLLIRSTNSEGVWMDNQIACMLQVQPMWWESSLFQTGLAVFLLALLIVSIRIYYNRKLEKHRILLEKQQAVEQERTRIATDMHDDLGAGLSRIKFLSDTIGHKKNQSLPIEEEVQKIKIYSSEMINKMGEIVWALNEKNDTLSDLLYFTRAYAAEYLSQNQIECIIEMPEQIPQQFVSGEFRRNIFLSVKEALHNIVKHAQASRVTINIVLHHQLSISITDNGIGLHPHAMRPFSNGLSNIEKRMKQLKGKAVISSEGGTRVQLEVPGC